VIAQQSCTVQQLTTASTTAAPYSCSTSYAHHNYQGNLAVVQALVEWSKQSNSSSTTTNESESDTPLHTHNNSSSSSSSKSISTWDLDLQGRTALALAAMEGHYCVVEYLKGVMESEAREGDIVGANAPVDLAGLTPLAWHVKSKVKVKRVVDKVLNCFISC
jgi:hypothetical protein